MEEQYYPARWQWETRRPEEKGFDPDKLTRAIEMIKASSSNCDWPHDIHQAFVEWMREDPFAEALGPLKNHGDTNGLILRDGYLVAEWGDTQRVDMTFSAAKSYIATMAGLAWDAGLIRDLDDSVYPYVPDGSFDSAHNRQITWHHLLQQTNEWEGALWDKPWYGDPQGNQTQETTLQRPGTVYAYNDVRVNRTALNLLYVWRHPLPQVLRERIMDPIGASHTWEWHGYENSWVTIDGLRMQSVSGGGHWGGGVWASTRDHARFGLLHARGGVWAGRPLLSEAWIERATRPGDVNPVYGYMWWLNTGHAVSRHAPERCFYAAGGGGNYIWVDQERDLVVVVRWTGRDALGAFIDQVIEAIRE